MQVRQIIIGIMLIGLPLAGYAQRPSRDNEKAKQWQSMENGPWDFAPDWYYYFLHNKYSGAEMYWKWAGFKSGFRVRFKEPKSSVKRIMPVRVTSEETQRQKVKKVEEERTHREIELRSEEVQEVMGRIPPAILRYGIVVLLGIMAVVLAGSACFSYPDTVETEFTLTTQNPPAYIMAQSAGRIEQLYTANSQPVGKGDMLGVIENVARTEDLFVLRERMKEWKQGGSRTEQVGTLFFHRIAELGSVQAAYSSCLLAWNNYLQHMQESRTYETEVANTVAGLLNAVAEWEKNYLLTAPADGTVAFMQLWKRNQYVEAGETMFVIVPHDAALPVGKALLPMEGIGKVRTGQRVIIRLPAFPEQEFGTIEGRVESVSPVPDEQGRFVLEIALPQGLTTRYGKELPLIKTMTGTASIVTKEKSLLSRLLNLK